MNIVEQVWAYMEKEKVKRAPVNLQQLWEVLQDIWGNIPVDFIQEHYDSVPRRLNEVYKPIGLHKGLNIESVIYQFVEIIL